MVNIMKKSLLLLALLIAVILIFTRNPDKPSESLPTKSENEQEVNIDQPSESQSAKDKFENEQAVNIIDYTDHAMEPFISRDGQYLFWNSLNDGKNTSLFYARRIDDSNFQFMGVVNGVNGKAPHLDAVASMDVNNNFYWVSTRDWPKIFENYQYGKWNKGVVTGVNPVAGDFYIRQPGWIVMDAEISPDGKTLFFVTARFTGGEVPEESDIGVARKIDGKFVNDSNSEVILRNINTKDDLEYAPSISADGMEIFFTRLIVAEKGTRIYVSRRDSIDGPFGKPEPLDIKGNIPEAPSITSDGQTIYYHKKDGQYFRIYKMRRVS